MASDEAGERGIIKGHNKMFVVYLKKIEKLSNTIKQGNDTVKFASKKS